MWITFDGILNTRDLGGVETADGRYVKEKRLLRGGPLHAASDADIRRLQEEFSLRAVVDFRDPDECRRKPDRAVPGAAYGNYPALPELPGKGPLNADAVPNPDFDAVFHRIYTQLAESETTVEAYRAFFRILLSEDEGGVYWHCTQGKDRTGVAALLLLAALGVSREKALEGYFLSNEGLRGEYEKPMTGSTAQWSDAVKAKLFFVYPEIVSVFFDHIDAAYGGEIGYLKARLGLTDADIARLRAKYLE